MDTRPGSYRDLAGIPGLPALLGAMTLLRLGGSMLSLTLVLHALDRFSSPALAGWVAFAAVAPGLAISPLAGAALDRIGPGIGVTIDMAASAALIAVLIVADRLGWIGPAGLLVLVGLLSLTSPLSSAGVRVMLPRLVTPAAYDRVNALDTAVFAVVQVAGPAAAGMLVGLAGADVALAAVATAFAASAFCIGQVRRLPAPVASGGSLIRFMLDGIRLVARQPTLRGLAMSYSLYQASWGVLVILVPVLVTRQFDAATGRTAVGLIWAATGFAGGVGALLAGRLRTAGRERPVMALGMLATALAAWPIGTAFGPDGLVAGLLLAGLAAGPIDVAVLTLRQLRTDPAQLGRVLSVSISLNMAGFPLGSALAGILIAHSLQAAFALAGLASLLGAAAVAAVPREDTR